MSVSIRTAATVRGHMHVDSFVAKFHDPATEPTLNEVRICKKALSSGADCCFIQAVRIPIDDNTKVSKKWCVNSVAKSYSLFVVLNRGLSRKAVWGSCSSTHSNPTQRRGVNRQIVVRGRASAASNITFLFCCFLERTFTGNIFLCSPWVS